MTSRQTELARWRRGSGRHPGPLPPFVKREDWMADAACRNAGVNMFPERGSHDQADAAKAVCVDCPVRRDCLEYALARNERHGIWGGYAERERRAIRRERRQVAS